MNITDCDLSEYDNRLLSSKYALKAYFEALDNHSNAFENYRDSLGWINMLLEDIQKNEKLTQKCKEVLNN